MEDRGGFVQCIRWIVTMIALASLMTLSTVSLAEAPAVDKKIKFDLAPMPFPKAILEYSDQANIEVIFIASDDLHEVITPQIKGELSPREALARLVAGTRLIFEFDTDHSAVVRPPYSAQDSMVELDIPAGPAAQTLPEWSRQAGRRLVFDRSAVKRYRTEAIKGRFDPIDSLLRMIHGTDLLAAQVNEQTYSVTVTRKRVLASQAPEEVLIAASHVKATEQQIGEPSLIFNRADIDAAGVDSVPEFLASIPQVWGGGPNEYSEVGREAQTNSTRGSGLNFHALGAESTLILIDGVRPAKSGTEAGWWDDSLLPLSAIERIEIVPDGGSLRYGSDAVAAVVNFVTRSDFTGAETQVQLSDTTEGGGRARRVSQLLGHHWGTGDASIILEYYDRDSVSAGSRPQATSDLLPWGATNWNSPNGYPGNLITGGRSWAITGVLDGKPVLGPVGSSNTYDRWHARDVLPWQQRFSVMTHASIRLDDIRIWSSLWLSDRHSVGSFGDIIGAAISIPSTNPGYVNPLGTQNPVTVQYGFGNLLGPTTYDNLEVSTSAATGLTIEKLGWSLDVSAQTGFERDRALQGGIDNFAAFEQALAAPNPLNPFAPASSVDPRVLAGLSMVEYYQSYSRIHELDASAGRVLQSGAAGDAQFSIGAQYRQESLSSFNSLQGWESADRRVRSIYGNLDLPIIGKSQAVPWVTRLGVSIGGRYENYSDGGAMTSPFASLEWSPTSTLSLRGTYRRGFRPPALTERLTVGNISEIITLTDKQTALAENGGNPNLRSEVARTWTGGVDYKPTERIQLSATYYTVASFGRVFDPTFTLNLAAFNGLVIENPTAAQRAVVCAQSEFLGASKAMCTQTPLDLIMDGRLLSLDKLTTSGIDLRVQYATDEWKFRIDGTYLLSYQGAGNGVILEQLNTINNPVDLRFRATAAHKIGPLTLTGAVSYTDSYWDISEQPRRRIGSWTTVDLGVTYKPADPAWLDGAELSLAVRNLMDRTPPFANDGQVPAGWDPANGGDLEGRIVSGQIRWSW